MCIASSLFARVVAQPTQPIPLGEQVTISSVILGEDRPVLIYTPPGYASRQDSLPVMYLLDGDTHLLHTAGITEFLARNGLMPEMLIVALPNTDRTRDLTPQPAEPVSRFPTAGGADAFLAFISDELQPAIEQQYRTVPHRVLVGHSFGGLFAFHAWMTRPEVFDAYIAISPSLWWDNKGLLPKAEDYLEAQKGERGFLYMSMGNEGGMMLSAAWGMAGLLEEKAVSPFSWTFDLLESETHGTIPHRSTYRALSWLYEGWSVTTGGAVFSQPGLDAIDAHFQSLSEKYGYTVHPPEALVNAIGYSLIQQKKYDEAITVMQRNVAVYPQSINVYDSLGDAYDQKGDRENARVNYAIACRRARAVEHANEAVYCANLERVEAEGN